MAVYDTLARAVALVGAGAIRWRRLQGRVQSTPAMGPAPDIPQARPQGRIPTLKMPTAQGWSAGQSPSAAAGLKVNAFAAGLKHPRWIQVLPNGDVTVAEALQQAGGAPRTLFDHAMVATMRRAAALGESPNRITLLRDADGDGVAEQRHAFLENLPSAWRWSATPSTSATPTAWWPSPTRRAPRASRRRRAGCPRSSPAATGRAACCPAPTGGACTSVSVR
jgi:glucose/arabinose dehydrogenase